MSKTSSLPDGMGTLPLSNYDVAASRRKHLCRRHALLGVAAILLAGALLVLAPQHAVRIVTSDQSELDLSSLYSSVHLHDDSDDLCPGYYGKSVSHSGYIGLKDDKPGTPRRSFFW